jgi:hypothetical protein
MRLSLSAALVLAAFLTAGCAGVRRSDALLAARSPDEAWSTLLEAREEFRGARAFGRVRVTADGRTSSFRARIGADPGDLVLSVVSPVGIEMATIHADGERLLVIDHMRRTWWRGSPEDAGGGAVVAFLAAAGPAQLSYLLFGLPPPGVPHPCGVPEVDGRRCFAIGEGTYLVGRGGIEQASVALGGGGVLEARYDGYPPGRLMARMLFPSGAAIDAEVGYAEIITAERDIIAPDIDPSYRCCVLPAEFGTGGS